MFLVLVGAVLRVAQYLANRSLWVNEADLALNILNRGFRSLTGELDFNQGAPIGFLFVEKVLTIVIGSSEYALRLFPLVCSLASVYLFLRLARKLVTDYVLPVALLLFATASGLIYYASEVKQYSSDVAATLLLTLVASSVLDEDSGYRRNAAAAVVGLLVIPFSHAAIFVALSIVVVLSADLVRHPRSSKSRRFLPILITWTFGAAVVIALSLKQLGHLRTSLTNAPLTIGYSLHSLNTLATDLGQSLGFLAAPEWASSLLLKLAAAVSVVGVVSLLRRHTATCLILFLPAVFAYMTSLVSAYPLLPRTILFVLPAGIIALAEGVAAVARALPRRLAVSIGVTLAAALCAVPVSSAAYHLVRPRHHEELRPLLGDIRRSWRPGDSIYVLYGTQYAFLYYLQCDCVDLSSPAGRNVPLWRPRPRRFGTDEFAPALASRPPGFFVGPDARFDVKASYLRELRRLRGLGRRRVWVVYAHLSNDAERRFVEGPWIMRLDEIGKRLKEFHATQAHAFLYDFFGNSVAATSRRSGTQARTLLRHSHNETPRFLSQHDAPSGRKD